MSPRVGQTHLSGSQYLKGPDRVAGHSTGRTPGSLTGSPRARLIGREGLVRSSGRDGPQQMPPSQAGLQPRIPPCPQSGLGPCGHLPRSPGLQLSEAGFRPDPRSSSFMGLQAWVSWPEGRKGWQPWGSREGLRATRPQSLGPWLRSGPLFSKG